MSWIHRKALAVVVAGAAIATILGATLGIAVAKHTSTVGGVCSGGSPGCNIHYVGAIKSGSVKTLVILGGNPVYNAPADLDWLSRQTVDSTTVS